MIRLIRNLVRYKLAKGVTRKTAKTLGFGKIAPLIGVIAGIRAMRRS